VRRVIVRVDGMRAALLEEVEVGRRYRLVYLAGYDGPPVSLTLPSRREPYEFEGFPPFFEGLLPEGQQLEGLLRQARLDGGDLLGQLIAVGSDLVGAVTVEETASEDPA